MEESFYTLLIERNVQLKDFQIVIVTEEEEEYAIVTENTVNNYDYYSDLFENIVHIMLEGIDKNEMLPGESCYSSTRDYEVEIMHHETTINMYSMRFETRFTYFLK
jgi:hypothetical protein